MNNIWNRNAGHSLRISIFHLRTGRMPIKMLAGNRISEENSKHYRKPTDWFLAPKQYWWLGRIGILVVLYLSMNAFNQSKSPTRTIFFQKTAQLLSRRLDLRWISFEASTMLICTGLRSDKDNWRVWKRLTRLSHGLRMHLLDDTTTFRNRMNFVPMSTLAKPRGFGVSTSLRDLERNGRKNLSSLNSFGLRDDSRSTSGPTTRIRIDRQVEIRTGRWVLRVAYSCGVECG